MEGWRYLSDLSTQFHVLDFLSGGDLAAIRITEVFEALHSAAPNSWPC